MSNFLFCKDYLCALWWIPLLLTTFLCGLWFAKLIWAKFAERLRLAEADSEKLEGDIGSLRNRVSNLKKAAKAAPAANLKSGKVKGKGARADLSAKGPKGPKGKVKGPELGLKGKSVDVKGPDLGIKGGDVNVKGKSIKGGSLNIPTTKVDPDLGTIYVKAPADVDDLTKIDGIDGGAANKLNGMGIYKYDQLANLKRPQFEALKRKAGFGFSWGDWGGKLKGLGLGIAGLGGAVAAGKAIGKPETNKDIVVDLRNQTPELKNLVATKFRGEDVKVDPEYGVIYNTAPAEVDDLTQLEAIDANTASELNKMGIYKVKQLEHLNEDQFDALKTKTGWSFNWGDWGSKFKGVGTGGETVNLIGRAGNKVTETTSEAAKPKVEATVPKAKGEAIKVDPEIGVTYDKAPNDADDLTKLDGVDASMAAKLNSLGIYKVQQLENLTEAEFDAIKRKTGWSFSWGDWGNKLKGIGLGATAAGAGIAAASAATAKAEVSATPKIEVPETPQVAVPETPIAETPQVEVPETPQVEVPETPQVEVPETPQVEVPAPVSEMDQLIATKFKGEDVSIDRRVGVIYTSRPHEADDLTQLQDIDSDLQEQLNDMGVYKLKQLENLNEAQFDYLKMKTSWNYSWIGFGAQLKEFGKKPSDGGGSSDGGSSAAGAAGAAGIAAAGAAAASGVAGAAGAVTSASASSLGASKAQEETKKAEGNAYTVHTESSKRDADSKAFTIWSDPNIDDGLKNADQAHFSSAASESFSGEDVDVSDLGIVYKTRPDIVDSLQDIKGVGPHLENQLHEFGVYRFKQVALWTPEVIEEFSERLAFKGRIERENWIEQANNFWKKQKEEKS